MNHTNILFFIFISILICKAQTTETKYFMDSKLKKEVSIINAKYSQSILKHNDSTLTIEIKDIKNNEIINRETYKGEEPSGIWIKKSGKMYLTLDYNFPLYYATEKCNEKLPFSTLDFFQDNVNFSYKAPKISTGENTIFEFVKNNTIYPSRSREQGKEGRVLLQFTLTKEGELEDIVIIRSANVVLDKEAVRVLRKLKLTSPPTIKSQEQTIKCIIFPIIFKLS